MEDGSVRRMREEWEKQMLSPYATLVVNTRGREVPMALCPVRTEFVRDRDRILHSKSFRRLKHKTQVFLAPKGDHYRTRLTHTLEVTQIARTISRALRLNEDLTEAISSGRSHWDTMSDTPRSVMRARKCSTNYCPADSSTTDRACASWKNSNTTAKA